MKRKEEGHGIVCPRSLPHLVHLLVLPNLFQGHPDQVSQFIPASSTLTSILRFNHLLICPFIHQVAQAPTYLSAWYVSSPEQLLGFPFPKSYSALCTESSVEMCFPSWLCLAQGPLVFPFPPLGFRVPCSPLPHACDLLSQLGRSPACWCVTHGSCFHIFSSGSTPLARFADETPPGLWDLSQYSIFFIKLCLPIRHAFLSVTPGEQWFLLIAIDSITLSWSVSLIY